VSSWWLSVTSDKYIPEIVLTPFPQSDVVQALYCSTFYTGKNTLGTVDC
jgi:hypothetical protein